MLRFFTYKWIKNMILHTPNSKPARMATVLETTILLYPQVLWARNLDRVNWECLQLLHKVYSLYQEGSKGWGTGSSFTCPVPELTWFKAWTKPRSLARSPVHCRSTEMGLLSSQISYITAQDSKTMCSHEQGKSNMAFCDQTLELALHHFCHTLSNKAT